LDDGRVENLRGLCPIRAALGLEEITRCLNASGFLQKQTDPQILLRFAVNNKSFAAVGLLHTAWSPTSYLHHIPEYTSRYGVGPWIGDPSSKGTLLHEAARRKDIEMVETLINAGASIQGRDHRSRTPYEMLYACVSKFSKATRPSSFQSFEIRKESSIAKHPCQGIIAV
jgi:ankyrin repeat protein